MFDSICLHSPQEVGSAFDLGLLAEAMVFYRHTRILADPAELISLLRICGPDSLCSAMESGFIQIVYLENHLGVASVNPGTAKERFGLIFFESPKQKLEELVQRTLFTWTSNRRRSRVLTERLLRNVQQARWEKPFAQDARNDILDPQFCNVCAKAAIKHLSAGYVPPDAAHYEVRLEKEFVVEERGFTMDMSIETDFDLDQANRSYRKAMPDAKFDKATVLAGIFGALTDLKTAATFSDEMVVSPSGSAIAQLKLARLLGERERSDQQIELFQEWTCEEGRAIREAVQSKRHSFEDILRLVEAASRFKDWLAKQPESSELTREYLKAICSVSWADKLPPKAIRLLLFTAVGGGLGFVVSPVGGLAASAALNTFDYFLVDRLVKGWKPNQFVEGPLRRFIESKVSSGVVESKVSSGVV